MLAIIDVGKKPTGAGQQKPGISRGSVRVEIGQRLGTAPPGKAEGREHLHGDSAGLVKNVGAWFDARSARGATVDAPCRIRAMGGGRQNSESAAPRRQWAHNDGELL